MKKFAATLGLFVPLFAFAADPQLTNVNTLIRSVGDLINLALPIVVALALLYFFYGLAQFILASGDEESRKKGKSIMIWGIVALFVMVSVWGLVAFLGRALGIEQGQSLPSVPTVNTTR